MAIVPAYNEGKKIEQVVKDLLLQVDSVVVIDDASTDKTGVHAKRAGAHVLSHRINRGQGAALETGHIYARMMGADYVVHFDGDGQMSAQDIPPALEHLKENNADMLVGSRYLGQATNMPWSKRNILAPLARLVDRIFSGVKLTDSHCGFRVLGQKALGLIHITQDGMAHATQIIALSKQQGLRLVEFPVHITYEHYGQGALGGLKIIKELILGKIMKL